MMGMTTTEHANTHNLTLTFLLTLGAYFVLHIVLRVTLSGSLDYDEAEQVLLSQWFQAGYTEQPPLYTWLQQFVFLLFGKNVFAVSLLKNCLLFLTYTCVFFAAREILGDVRTAILAALSLLLIPQIGWESQRDMTHTTLVVFAAAATLWQVMRLIKIQNLTNYGLLGLLLGVGFLAKSNFLLFVAVLLLTLSSFAEGRKVIFSKKIVVGLLILAACIAPHVLWIADNQDIILSATRKFKSGRPDYLYKGITSLIATSLCFLAPMCIAYLFVFPDGFRLKRSYLPGLHRQFISRYLLFLFLILAVVVIVGKVTAVKDRWLQPLLFVAPIFFFARIAPSAITPARFKLFLRIIAVAALAIYIAFTIRVAGVSFTKNFRRLNYPFSRMGKEMRDLGFANGLIISNDRFIAGNLHFQFPRSTALIPGYRFAQVVDQTRYSQAAVVWQPGKTPEIPDDLREFVENTYNIKVGDYRTYPLEYPYLYARAETVTCLVLFFPLATPPAKKEPAS